MEATTNCVPLWTVDMCNSGTVPRRPLTGQFRRMVWASVAKRWSPPERLRGRAVSRSAATARHCR